MAATKITTAVFPVGGLGTRFLPATKASPKEMLPIVDKPLVQYVVEEAISAGITQLVFVTSNTKRAIEDYFDTNYELECRLEAVGKLEVLSRVRSIVPEGVNFVYVRQPAPLGLGDAVLRAKHVVGQEPFAVLLADDIIDNGAKSCLASMCDVYEDTQSSVLAVESVPKKDTDKYGIVSLVNSDTVHKKVGNIVEKPKPDEALSNLAVVGRYILTPVIFDYLESAMPGVAGELQLTDAIAAMLEDHSVYVHPFAGTRYDCGSRLGMVKATLNYALKDKELKHHLEEFMTNLVN